jgi:hypothetical protein
MAGLDKRRIEALERLYAMGEESALQSPEWEERRAALHESLRRGWERAEREEAAGDSRRRRALEDLQRRMRERSTKRS